MEHVLWNQMTQKYLDNIEQKNREQCCTAATTSHYKINFNGQVIMPHTKIPEANWIDEVTYPLYGKSEAISFWNQTEAINFKGYKQSHPLTKLNSECFDEQRR